MIEAKDWQWFGHAGHLCVGASCRFHLCTRVGKYLISTVGDYYPYGQKDGSKRETIGAGEDSFFECYVFRVVGEDGCKDETCGCGMPEVRWLEIEGRRYATAGAAREAHMQACIKYARRKK